jgi:hypothetical protein
LQSAGSVLCHFPQVFSAKRDSSALDAFNPLTALPRSRTPRFRMGAPMNLSNSPGGQGKGLPPKDDDEDDDDEKAPETPPTEPPPLPVQDPPPEPKPPYVVA